MTFHIEVLQRISALIGNVPTPCRMWVTSTHWGAIADEINSVSGDTTLKATNRNFRELRIGGNLVVLNLGTEDQEVVNIANREEATRVEFASRRERLRTG